MAITILVPTSIADRCYLIEALMWVAVNRFPPSAHTVVGTGADDREEDTYRVQGVAPFLPHDVTVSDDECQRFGLPFNPAYKALRDGMEIPTPEDIRHTLSLGLSQAVTKRYEEFLPISEDFHRRKADWDAQFRKFVAPSKARLLSALQQGGVASLGKKIASGILDQVRSLEAFRWPEAPTERSEYVRPIPPWEPIPRSFWTSVEVRWEQCWAESRTEAYCLILLETKDLLDYFPPPPAEPFSGVVRVGTTLVLEETRGPIPAAPRVGRRPFDWNSIWAEVERRRRTVGLPRKMDALIADMTPWCLEKFGEAPAQKTMYAQLKRFYPRS